jgi:hypothetical protein
VSSTGGTRWHLLGAALLACAVALFVPATALANGSQAEAIRVEVPTPAAGDVTIEEITTTIPSHVSKFPELELYSRNARALPPSVIALTATRTQRGKRSTTFRTLMLVLDRSDASSSARAAADEALGAYTAKLILGEVPEKTMDSLGTYAGLSFAFTGVLPSDIDTWTQQRRDKNGVLIDVGAQPNANAADTDVRTCWALTDTVKLASTGKPAPGLTYRFFDGAGALSWSHDGIGQAFVNFTRDCHAGADGLSTALTPVENDLGLGPGALGSPPPTTGLKPIGKEQAEEIFFGALLDEEPAVAWKALEDYVLWLFLEELAEFLNPAPDALLAAAAPGPAHASSTRTGAVPESGQVTKVQVRGYFAGGCPVAAEVCEDNLHFQDLRPLPDGELEIVSTTQAFTLPDHPGTYTYEPTNFFVQKGDFIGLASVGGEFDVLVKRPAAQTDVFVGHDQDMNGDKIPPAKTQPQAGEELNMRVTLKPSE